MERDHLPEIPAAAPEVLQQLTPEDLADFVRLRPQLSQRTLSEEEIACHLIDAIESPDARVLVVRDENGRIQATVSGGILHPAYGPKAWVDDVVTDSEHRQQGHAENLMHALHEWFIERGITTTQLLSNSKREAAGRLYERLGYSQRPTRVYITDL